MIPYGHQSINDADVNAVVESLNCNLITQGPGVPQFEKAVADYCTARYGLAVNSATSALFLACKVLGLGSGDWLWTSPNTFVASANCALYCGADVDFVDIDPQTYNMSVDCLRIKLAKAAEDGCLPKIVVPVHFAGQSCDMEEMAVLSHEYGFSILEDASHAIGGEYQQGKIGSCKYSDMTVFSFHPVKIITTGEGGMILTRKRSLHHKLSLLRSHGITRDPLLMEGESHGPWYYQQITLGYNFRMTELQAALGLSQLKRLDEFLKDRHAVVKLYNESFADLPLGLPQESNYASSAWHLYVIRLSGQLIQQKREIFQALLDRGIGVNVHYIPVHLQPYYKKEGFEKGDFPEAEKYYSQAITLPLYHRMSSSDQSQVILSVADVIEKFSCN